MLQKCMYIIVVSILLLTGGGSVEMAEDNESAIEQELPAEEVSSFEQLPIEEVSSFEQLLALSEAQVSKRVILTNDIEATEDVRFWAAEGTEINVELDLNGYTLQFARNKNLDIGSPWDEVKLSVISGREGGTISFLYAPEMERAGGIYNSGTLILKDILVETANTPAREEEVWISHRGVLIAGSGGSLVMEATTLRSSRDDICAIRSGAGHTVTITDSLIEVEGAQSIGIANHGGIMEINNSAIHAKGDDCVGVTSVPRYDMVYSPGGKYIRGDDFGGNDKPYPVLTHAVLNMNNSAVTASGSGATGLEFESNVTLTDSEITASGRDSVDLARYRYGLEDENAIYEPVRINGMISDEADDEKVLTGRGTVAALDDTALPIEEVSSFEQLLAISEAQVSKRVILTNDIEATEDIWLWAIDGTELNVELDLNGYALRFANHKSLRTSGWQGKVRLSVVSSREGGTISFLYASELGLAGGIDNGGALILKDILVETTRSPVKDEEFVPSNGSALLSTGGRGSSLVIESSTLRSSRDYMEAISGGRGKVTITNSLIELDGQDSIGITNIAGVVEISDSAIHVKGDNCLGIASVPYYEMGRNPHTEYIRSYQFGRPDHLFPVLAQAVLHINNSVVTASGNGAIGVEFESNITFTNSEIIATGSDSVGLLRYRFGVEDGTVTYEPVLVNGTISGEAYAVGGTDDTVISYINGDAERIEIDPDKKTLVFGE